MLHLNVDPGRDRAEVLVVVSNGVVDAEAEEMEAKFFRVLGVDTVVAAIECLVDREEEQEEDVFLARELVSPPLISGEAKFKVPMRSDLD